MSVLINNDTAFLLGDEAGDITSGAELGLYIDDTRVLGHYALALDERPPIPLAARSTEPSASLHFMTNPALEGAARGSLSIVRRRRLDDGLLDAIEVTNYGRRAAHLSIGIDIEPDASHIIDVRQRLKRADPHRKPPLVYPRRIQDSGRYRFQYEDTDQGRRLVVDMCQPLEIAQGRLRCRLQLVPRETWHLCVRIVTDALADRELAAEACQRRPGTKRGSGKRPRAMLVDEAPHLDTDSSVLRAAYRRSVRDLAALRIEGGATSDGDTVIAAGIPWFMALFGRDSLIAAYQCLPFYPEAAKGVLRALARLQGRRVDALRCEEPGKILHEHRPGSTDGVQSLIPGFPYFGTIDATPLFLVLLAAVYRLTGDLEFVRSLRGNALRVSIAGRSRPPMFTLV